MADQLDTDPGDLRPGDLPEFDYEHHKTAIFKALVLGIMADELPDLERVDIDRIAGWLASERIGKVS